MSKEELNECLKCFYTSARKRDSTYYKNTSMKSIRAAIDRFLRSPPNNKSFSIISDAVFTEGNKIFDAFVKDLRKLELSTRKQCQKMKSRGSIEQQKKMSHVLSDFVSAGASEASPSTGISAAEKENECHGQQERQSQSEGTVSVQNQFVNTEVRQSERRSFPQVFFNCNVQVHNYYGGGELGKSQAY